jgi:UDP:flavonoid glycosyltransferase YjiC (YdhE family)
MAAVVHHGGSGTTAAAAVAGIPQIIVPHALDQFYWAHRVEKVGIGPRAFASSKLTAERLARSIRRATTDADIVNRAGQLGARMSVSQGLARAVETVDHLSKSFRTKNSHLH